MAVTVTNQKTTFDANTNADIQVDIGSGAAGSGTQRVILATDQPTLPVTATAATLTPAAPTAASVGVASGQILASATYKRVELTNTSTSTISIGIGAAAVLNSGMTLIGTGSAATIEGPFTAAVHAIASGAASNLAIQAFT